MAGNMEDLLLGDDSSDDDDDQKKSNSNDMAQKLKNLYQQKPMAPAAPPQRPVVPQQQQQQQQQQHQQPQPQQQQLPPPPQRPLVQQPPPQQQQRGLQQQRPQQTQHHPSQQYQQRPPPPQQQHQHQQQQRRVLQPHQQRPPPTQHPQNPQRPPSHHHHHHHQQQQQAYRQQRHTQNVPPPPSLQRSSVGGRPAASGPPQPSSSSSRQAHPSYHPPPQQQQQQQQPQPQARSGQSQLTAERIQKNQKDKFLVFTRVLLRYIEGKDKALYAKVKAIIKDCALRNQRKEAGYESVTASMKARLQQVVPTQIWTRAEAYMHQFLQQKKKKAIDSTKISEAERAKLQQVKQEQKVAQQKAQATRAPAATPRTTTNTAKPAGSTTQKYNPPASSATSKAAPAKKKAAPQQTQQQRKPSIPIRRPEGPAREYSNLVDLIDHSADLQDWSSTALLLGPPTVSQLSSEEKVHLKSRSHTSSAAPPVVASKQWHSQNVVNARTVWARVRLPEGGDDTKWINEDVAQNDVTLEALSNACQEYLRQVLRKAVHCSRQRQNLDGIRLWHQQQMAIKSQLKPALSIRLGCDVVRQVAGKERTAALTVKRLEQALDRRGEDTKNDEPSSMDELALEPKLLKATHDADQMATRHGAVWGGKHALDPPLGRLPKKAKLSVADLQAATRLSAPRRRQRALTAASSIAF